jgi:hypothetical protein
MRLDVSHELNESESHLSQLEHELMLTKQVVADWNDAGVNLSRSAASARAKNQGAGRGFVSALLGSKFRSAMRAGAAASNSAIAKDVARKRAETAAAKASTQSLVKKAAARFLGNEIQNTRIEVPNAHKIITEEDRWILG